MGRAVSIHPLAVVLAISTGGVLAGIVGALLAVPTVAFFNSAFKVLLAEDPAAEEPQEARRRFVLAASRTGRADIQKRLAGSEFAVRSGPRGAAGPER